MLQSGGIVGFPRRGGIRLAPSIPEEANGRARCAEELPGAEGGLAEEVRGRRGAGEGLADGRGCVCRGVWGGRRDGPKSLVHREQAAHASS